MTLTNKENYTVLKVELIETSDVTVENHGKVLKHYADNMLV